MLYNIFKSKAMKINKTNGTLGKLFLTFTLFLVSLISLSSCNLIPSSLLESPVFVWISNNWIAIGLIVSEIAALLPGQYSGIIQSLLKFLDFFFKRSNKAIKKGKL